MFGLVVIQLYVKNNVIPIHINTKSTFWEIIIFFKTKENQKVAKVCIFQISVVFGLIEDRWLLIYASAIYHLQHVVLVEVYEDKSVPLWH